MSFAWEVNKDDVAIVLERRSIATDAEQVFDEHFVGCSETCDRVERAALSCTDFEEQYHAALDEIEAILIEAGVIPS